MSNMSSSLGTMYTLSRLAMAGALILLTSLHSSLVCASEPSADLILYNGKVWTVDDGQPWAEAVAIRGNRIAQVGANREILALAGPATTRIDLGGKLVLPAFNDAHVHFELALDWYFQVRLVDVNSQEELAKRLAKMVKHMKPGIWITGGDWSTFDARRAARAGVGVFQAFKPDLKAINALTPNNPVLFRNYNHEYFANSATFRIGKITKDTPNPPGGVYEKDPVTGELTGMLLGAAGQFVFALVPPVTLAQKRLGAIALQRELHSMGIASVADISRVDAITQQRMEFANIERAYSDLRIWEALKSHGELKLRVHPILPLSTLNQLASVGIRPGSGDAWIRYGTLKSFADSGMMLKPFVGHGLSGNWTFRFPGEDAIVAQIKEADAMGFNVGVHVIGDRAFQLVVEAFDKASRDNPVRDRRHRMIHAWYATPADLALAGKLRLFADVTPEHFVSGIEDMNRGLDSERAKTAHAWQSMIKNGMTVNIVSDLPGAYNKSSVATVNPMENIFHAITRKPTLAGQSWHPEQALSVEQAIRAYTINPARASGEERDKGSITPGKLADLVVLSNDIVTGDPALLLRTRVLHTIVDGKTVYQSD